MIVLVLGYALNVFSEGHKHITKFQFHLEAIKQFQISFEDFVAFEEYMIFI